MCHYITAVLPTAADHRDLDAVARGYGRQFLPVSNPSIASQIGRDEAYFMTTTEHCDCGTPLGALAAGAGRAPDWPEQEQRLLRKGWSKAKAARAIAQRQASLRASVEGSAEAQLQAMSSWLDFIRAIVGSGKTSYLGLLLHMYSGSIESRIDLLGRETVHLSELSGDRLGRMREDVLYVFRP